MALLSSRANWKTCTSHRRGNGFHPQRLWFFLCFLHSSAPACWHHAAPRACSRMPRWTTTSCRRRPSRGRVSAYCRATAAGGASRKILTCKTSAREFATAVGDLASYLASLLPEARAAFTTHSLDPATLSNLELLPRNVRAQAEHGLQATEAKSEEALPSLRMAWADAHDMHSALESLLSQELERKRAAILRMGSDGTYAAELRHRYAESLGEARSTIERCRPPPIGDSRNAVAASPAESFVVYTRR